MLPALVVGCIYWLRLPKFIRLFVIHVAISIMVINVAAALSRPNQGLFNCYMIVDFLLIFTACFEVLPKRLGKYFAPIGVSVFVGSWLFSIRVNGYEIFASQALIVASMIIAITCFFALVELFLESKYDRGYFILFFIVLVYHSGTIPIFSFINYLNAHNRQAAFNVYNIIELLNAIRYLGLALGLYFIGKGGNKKEKYG